LLAVSVPVLAVLIAIIVSRMVPQFRLMQERIDVVNRVLREQISGVRVVRAFVREREEAERFSVANCELTDTATRAGRWQATMFPTVMIVVNLSSIAVIWFGGHRVGAGEMQVGSLTAYLSYLMQIVMSIMMATFMLMMIPRASVCADRIGEVLDEQSSVVPPRDPVTAVHGRGEVEFRAVGFRYPGAAAPVLRDISLRIGPGTTTAIIGSTGAGKTTLLSLIPRLVDVTEGAVLVDGVDVRDLDPELLCERIGYVPQQSFLFSGTVASNLRYGRPEATDEELWHALEVAQARDFVAALPGGLSGQVAQGGTSLSGGQRQRLAIARALVRRPEIYLFDDALSALDVGTDARLRAALKPETRDAAVVIVAQRVSTVVDADQIVVLDDGVIVGVGTHDELLGHCPAYAEIVQSQLSAEEAA
jgi:ATP-binding cassette subfamily B protein